MTNNFRSKVKILSLYNNAIIIYYREIQWPIKIIHVLLYFIHVWVSKIYDIYTFYNIIYYHIYCILST